MMEGAGSRPRLKEFEKESARLKRVVADLAPDKAILEEAAEGNL